MDRPNMPTPGRGGRIQFSYDQIFLYLAVIIVLTQNVGMPTLSLILVAVRSEKDSEIFFLSLAFIVFVVYKDL